MIRTSTKLECRRLGAIAMSNAIRVLLDLQGNVQYVRAIQGHSGPQELDLTYFTLNKMPYMWIFLVHASARRTTADPVSKEAFMQEATDGEGTFATSRPQTSWKSHCHITQRFPATSPRWSVVHTGRKAYFENRARSRCVILSNQQQRDRPLMYDAIICLDEQKKNEGTLGDRKTVGMRKTPRTKIPKKRCRSNTRNAFPQTRTCSTRQRKTKAVYFKNVTLNTSHDRRSKGRIQTQRSK